MSDLTDVISDFAEDEPNGGQYTVTRTTAGTLVNGRHIPGSTSTFPIVASRTPPTGRDLQVLATGQITAQAYRLTTATELLTKTPTTAPDMVDAEGDGVAWAVYQVDPYPDLEGGTFYSVLVARQAQT